MIIMSMITAIIVFSILIYIYLSQKYKNQKRNFNPSAMEETQIGATTVETTSFNPSLVSAKWAEIMTMQKAGPSGLRSALIEADKLLDYCMISRGFTGETMGDRLKNDGEKFSNINAIWSAHKLRNQLAHEVEHDIIPGQVQHAIEDLGQGIRDLGVVL